MIMATQTPKFGFTKPEVNDFYNVNVQNENWDEVDKALTKLNDRKLPSKRIYTINKNEDGFTGESVDSVLIGNYLGEFTLIRYASYICDASIKEDGISGKITRDTEILNFDNSNLKPINDNLLFICFYPDPGNPNEYHPDVVICLDYVTITAEDLDTALGLELPSSMFSTPNELSFKPGVYFASFNYEVTEITSNIPFHSYETGASPQYTYGTEDLVAGVSPLETGKLYFVYE